MLPPVADLLDRLGDAVSRKDLDDAVVLFWDDALLAGSGEEELASDGNIARFLTALYSLPFAISWDWQEPVVHVHSEDLGWFFVEGTLHATDMKDQPYRATGVVLRKGEEWRFSMWAGAEPT